jgi:RNA-directed DNA polymerase
LKPCGMRYTGRPRPIPGDSSTRSMNKVHRRDVLEHAWELVRRNRGAPGIDRLTIQQVERYGVDRLLDQLAAALKDGGNRPLPAEILEQPRGGWG